MRQVYLIIILGVVYSFNAYSQTWADATIYTPNGNPVSAQTLISGDLTSTQKTDSKNFWLNYYSNRITFLDEATLEYNCHAYAWHVSEAGVHVWLNDPNDDEYWDDGSYYRVYTETEDLKVSFGNCYGYHCFDYNKNGIYDSGECGYYDACDHSATTTTISGYFISKWGPSPLFRHYYTDCPYSQESGLRYYKLSTNSCRENYEDITITSNTTKTGCVLLVKNVSVSNNASLTLDVTDYVKIYGSFTVQAGSTLEIK